MGFADLLAITGVIYALVYDFGIQGQSYIFNQILGAIMTIVFTSISVFIKHRQSSTKSD